MELRERRVEENPRQPEKKNEEYLILTLKTSSSLTMNVIFYVFRFIPFQGSIHPRLRTRATCAVSQPLHSLERVTREKLLPTQ